MSNIDKLTIKVEAELVKDELERELREVVRNIIREEIANMITDIVEVKSEIVE